YRRIGVCIAARLAVCGRHLDGARAADRRLEFQLLVVRAVACFAFCHLLRFFAPFGGHDAEHGSLRIWIDPVLVHLLVNELWPARPHPRTTSGAGSQVFTVAYLARQCRLWAPSPAGRL